MLMDTCTLRIASSAAGPIPLFVGCGTLHHKQLYVFVCILQIHAHMSTYIYMKYLHPAHST